MAFKNHSIKTTIVQFLAVLRAIHSNSFFSVCLFFSCVACYPLDNNEATLHTACYLFFLWHAHLHFMLLDHMYICYYSQFADPDCPFYLLELSTALIFPLIFVRFSVSSDFDHFQVSHLYIISVIIDLLYTS